MINKIVNIIDTYISIDEVDKDDYEVVKQRILELENELEILKEIQIKIITTT